MSPQSVAAAFLLTGALVLIECNFIQSGFYAGWFRAQFDYDDGNAVLGRVVIKAESDSVWHWNRPRNLSYRTAEMATDWEWDNASRVTFDLSAGTWRWNGSAGRTTARTVPALIARIDDLDPIPEAVRPQMEFAHVVLTGLRDGPKWSDSHHIYYIDFPPNAQIRHHIGGWNVGRYLYWVWLAAWPVFLWKARRRPEPQGPRFSSVFRIYLKCVAVVVLCNIFCFAIFFLSTPGPIAESLELIGALVNLPAYLTEPVGWEFVIIGPVGWASVVSALGLLKATSDQLTDRAVDTTMTGASAADSHC